MNLDFDKMASEAKLAHEVRVALKSQQATHRKQERLRYVEEAVAAIASEVIPLLEQAIVAFGKHGIKTTVTRDFDVKKCMGKDPAITFKCVGRVDGAQFEGPAMCFSSDGAVITVGVATTDARASAEKLGSAAHGQSQALVAKAIERALHGLFAEMEREGGSETLTFLESPATTSSKSGDNAGRDFAPTQRLRSAS